MQGVVSVIFVSTDSASCQGRRTFIGISRFRAVCSCSWRGPFAASVALGCLSPPLRCSSPQSGRLSVLACFTLRL